jgi:hypothetical protein
MHTCHSNFKGSENRSSFHASQKNKEEVLFKKKLKQEEIKEI